VGRLVVGFGGARSCAGGRAALVRRVARAAALAGAEVRVGCASGVDSLVGSEVLRVDPGRLVLFCAWGPESCAAGSLRASAVESVGGSVVWWAGGRSGSVAERLRGRSVALARSGLSCFLAFPGPRSRGTWVAVRACVAAGVPVFVWPVGSSPLPSLGPGGRWVRVAASGFWSACWRWLPFLRTVSREPFLDLNHLELALPPEQPEPSRALVPYKGGAVDEVLDKVTGEIFRGPRRGQEKRVLDGRRRHQGQRRAFFAVINTILFVIAVLVWISVLYQPRIQPVNDIECQEVYRWDVGWTTDCGVDFTPKGGE